MTQPTPLRLLDPDRAATLQKRAQRRAQAFVRVTARYKIHVWQSSPAAWQVRASIGPAPYWSGERKTLAAALDWLAGEVREVAVAGLCDLDAAYQMLGWITRRQREHGEDARARLGRAVQRSKEAKA